MKITDLLSKESIALGKKAKNKKDVLKQMVDLMDAGGKISDKKLYLELFMTMMRMAYKRDIQAMKQWSEQVAAMGRERQKELLEYCQRMIRENFIMNFRRNEMLYLTPEERNFSIKFSPFVNENNIFGIMEELSEAQKYVEHNVNAKMIFFDMALRMIVWIKNR